MIPQYSSSTAMSRQQAGSQGGLAYHNSSRSSNPANYNGYSDEMPESFGLPSPNYLQAQEAQHQLPSVIYSSPEMARSWASLPSTTKQLHPSFSLDDGTTKYASSSFAPPSAQLSSSTSTTMSRELHSRFPAMGPLKTSLPGNGLNSRILPALDHRNDSNPLAKAHHGLPMIAGEGAGMPLQDRSEQYAEQARSHVNQHSVSSSDSGTLSGTEGGGSNSSSSPQTVQKSTPFPYRPTEQDRDADYSATYSAPSGFVSGLPDDNIQESSSSQYTYNLGSSTKHPEGTLSSGQIYMRLQSTSSSQTYDTLHNVPNHGLPSLGAAYKDRRTSISNSRAK